MSTMDATVSPAATNAPTSSSEKGGTAAHLLALLRLALGFVFIWAFADKLLALGFATGRADNGTVDVLGPAAWINGGSPTSGFLVNATEGPLAGLFQGMAGVAVVDWLFMLGLLGVGVALLLGIAMRIAAVAGATQMLLIRAATAPENNPLIDQHVIYAIALFALAAAAAGDHWGLGTAWRRTRLVQRFPLLA
jgi:thiosulfate dehydrogenase [quinone] large subunit